jgi:hypothetical protein
MRHYINIVDTTLTEAIVVNPDEVDAFVARFAQKTHPEEGKQWFAKKLRNYILNDENLLNRIRKDSEYLRLPDWEIPDYVKTALEKGEPVFAWENRSAKAQNLASKAEHLVDWFNALQSVANSTETNSVAVEDRVIAQRELSKLVKYNFDTAITTADAWFNHMGTRARGGSKEGVKVVANLQNGYYVVEYTSEETMKRDGTDLQNCLQQGYYWNAVQSGSSEVYTIRKPNDEAIVAIRVSGNVLMEVKGKNNKFVVPQYVPYVISFLNMLSAKVDMRGNQYSGPLQDLSGAGIYTKTENGVSRVGTLEDFSTEVNGIMVVDTDAYRIFKKGDIVVNLSTSRNAGNAITINPAGAKTPQETVDFLNDLAGSLLKGAIDSNKPLTNIKIKRDASYEDGASKVWFYNGKFGLITQLGEKIKMPKGFEAASFDVDNAKVVYVNKTDTGKLIFKVHIEKKRVTGVEHMTDGAQQFLPDLLNTLGFPPTLKVEERLAPIYYDGEKYGTLKQVGQKVAKVHDGVLYQIGNRENYVLQYGTHNELSLNIVRGRVLDTGRLTATRWAVANPTGLRELMNYFADKDINEVRKGKVDSPTTDLQGAVIQKYTWSPEKSRSIPSKPILSMEQYVDYFVTTCIPNKTLGFGISDSEEHFLEYRKAEVTPEMIEKMIAANKYADVPIDDPASAYRGFTRHTIVIDVRLFMIFKSLRIKVPQIVLDRMETAIKRTKEIIQSSGPEDVYNITHRMWSPSYTKEMANLVALAHADMVAKGFVGE